MTNRNKSTSTLRLKQDYLRLKRDPVPYITAEPLPQNILEWHYVVKGPEESPYFGGYYHGMATEKFVIAKTSKSTNFFFFLNNLQER